MHEGQLWQDVFQSTSLDQAGPEHQVARYFLEIPSESK